MSEDDLRHLRHGFKTSHACPPQHIHKEMCTYTCALSLSCLQTNIYIHAYMFFGSTHTHTHSTHKFLKSVASAGHTAHIVAAAGEGTRTIEAAGHTVHTLGTIRTLSRLLHILL